MIECEIFTKSRLDKIRLTSERYDQLHQLEKNKEELGELKAELDLAFADEQRGVCLPPATWAEYADMFYTSIQVIMQHGREADVLAALDYKINRQLDRMLEAGLVSAEEFERYGGTETEKCSDRWSV